MQVRSCWRGLLSGMNGNDLGGRRSFLFRCGLDRDILLNRRSGCGRNRLLRQGCVIRLTKQSLYLREKNLGAISAVVAALYQIGQLNAEAGIVQCLIQGFILSGPDILRPDLFFV